MNPTEVLERQSALTVETRVIHRAIVNLVGGDKIKHFTPFALAERIAVELRDARERVDEIVGYQTLQFHVGGLFDGKTIEEYVHLVRVKEGGGTPGPTLCGKDRFAKDAPGWSVGGGFSGEWNPCRQCDAARDLELPVSGMHRDLFPSIPTPRLLERAES